MAARTFTFGATVLDITDTAVIGLGIPITLLVPGNVPAVDSDSKTVLPDTITGVVTDSNGTYTTPLIYPGDISPPGCVYQIQEGSRTILSPVTWDYVSSVASWQWYAGGGAVGTLACFIRLVLGNDSPVSGRFAHVAPQQNTIAPDSSDLSVGTPLDALLDGTGTARFFLWPSSVLDPTTLYTCRIDGETTRFSFSVPATPTGYQGAYASGTAYLVHDGSAYQGPYTPLLNPPDVVFYNNLYYVAIADTTGHVPTNTTYWAPWLGENITWHLQPFGASQSVVTLPSSIAHDSGLPTPIAGAPWPSPTTLAQDLENLAFQADQATSDLDDIDGVALLYAFNSYV